MRASGIGPGIWKMTSGNINGSGEYENLVEKVFKKEKLKGNEWSPRARVV